MPRAIARYAIESSEKSNVWDTMYAVSVPTSFTTPSRTASGRSVSSSEHKDRFAQGRRFLLNAARICQNEVCFFHCGDKWQVIQRCRQAYTRMRSKDSLADFLNKRVRMNRIKEFDVITLIGNCPDCFANSLKRWTEVLPPMCSHKNKSPSGAIFGAYADLRDARG